MTKAVSGQVAPVSDVAIDSLRAPHSDSQAERPPDLLPNPRPLASWPTIVIAWCVALGAAYVAKDVLTPIALAVLLALILRPLLRRLQRVRFPTLPASLLVGIPCSIKQSSLVPPFRISAASSSLFRRLKTAFHAICPLSRSSTSAWAQLPPVPCG